MAVYKRQRTILNANQLLASCHFRTQIWKYIDKGSVLGHGCPHGLFPFRKKLDTESFQEKTCIPKRAFLWPRDNPVDVTSMIFVFLPLLLSIRIDVSKKLWPMNKVIMSISPDGDHTVAVELGGNWLIRTNATSFLSASSRSLVNSGNVTTSSWLIF
jgi:hypothetical protein